MRRRRANRCSVPLPRASGASRRENPVIKHYSCRPQSRTDCSDRALRQWCSRRTACGLLSCRCLSCASRVVPLQKLACMVTNTSDAVSHMRGMCRFKLYWPNNYMLSYLGKHMDEVHRVDVKCMVDNDSHELYCYWLVVRCMVHLRCTGDRVGKRCTCLVCRASADQAIRKGTALYAT